MSGHPFVSVVQEASSPKPEIRLHAAAVLANLGGREAEDALAALLADPDHRVRARATMALAASPRPQARAACAALVLDPASGAAGNAAARALGSRRGGGEALVEALASESAVVRLRAARELPGTGSSATIAVPLAAAARRELDADVRVELFLALGRTGRPEAVPVLVGALRRGSPHERAHAAWALGVLGDPRAAARLLAVLDEPGVGDCALASLAKVPSAEAAEELARRGARGAAGEALLLALDRGLACGGPALARRVRTLWPAVSEAAQELLARPGVPRGTAGSAAHLLARLDVPGAAALIVRHGPFVDGYAALGDLPPDRLADAVRTALVVDDAEPALALLMRGGVAVEPAALLTHPHSRVKVAALNRLAPGATPLSDLLEILAEDGPETALAASWALAREAHREGTERARAAAAALQDRAGGHDGPGRAAALVALREQPGAAVDIAIRTAFASHDPAVRAAAVASGGARPDLGERDFLPLLEDEDPNVRTEALVALARLAPARRTRVGERELRRFLTDDTPVAAAAGALLVAIAGRERPRIAREILAQRGAVRRAGLEVIPELRDAAAASAVAFAASHEDPSTARAVLEAAAVAPPPVAAEAVATGLADARAEVRVAAAYTAARAGDDLAAALAVPLAEALERETDEEVKGALLRAVATAGRADAIPALTRTLGEGADRPEGRAAAEALARRFPEAARAAWAAAPGRAGRAWGTAMEAARRSAGPSLVDDEADALRLLVSLARMRTSLAVDAEAARPRLALLLAAEAWAAGSFRRLWKRMRDLPPAHPLLGRLADAVTDTTSRFFGDPASLDALADEIAPERLLARGEGGALEVWCVGCGTGEEVWSVAIRLAERGLVAGGRVRVRGTDLSPEAIRQARAGVYGPHALRGVPEEIRTRHFQPLSNGRYRVRESLRASVFFECRALADEPPGAGKHDAIVCRGLLGQLPADARTSAIERLAACLKPGGYLLIGREDHDFAVATSLAPVLLGRDLAYRAPGAVVYTRPLA